MNVKDKLKAPSQCDVCKDPITGSWVKLFSGESFEARCEPCDRIKRCEKFMKDQILTTNLIMDATLNEYHKERQTQVDVAVLAGYEPIKVCIKSFEKNVWFNGLQSFARKSKKQGSSATHENFKMLCHVMAGRAVITLEDEVSMFTVITDETSTESRMGLQGIYATSLNAIDLLARAQNLWAEGKLKMVEDGQVHIAGC